MKLFKKLTAYKPTKVEYSDTTSIKPTCSWRTKRNGQLWDVWVTDCGHEYVEGRLVSNSPDNDMFKFCPYCGNEIR